MIREIFRGKFWFIGYVLFAIFFAIYSYSQVDLNLTFDQSSAYLSFQKQLTYLGFYQRNWSMIIFLFLSLGLFALYFLMIKQIRAKSQSPLEWLLPIIFVAIVLGFSYPSFSYDIFNYVFNTKMVWIYHTNPHLDVAASFPQDTWIRFMRNTHTPAPYGYGWTLLSLMPGVATLTSNFKLSLGLMKLFIGLFWLGQLFFLNKIIKEYFPKENWRWFLFALNPLVLIETLGVGHNDVVMMCLVLISLRFLLKSKKLMSKEFIFSLIFLIASVTIKYATIILLPLWLLKPYFKRLDLGMWGGIALLAVMFTRPDQLHSWYLIWAFSLAVLAENKWGIALFTAATFGALIRYAPYLYFGSWDPPVYLYRNLIWVGSLLLALKLKNFLLSISSSKC